MLLRELLAEDGAIYVHLDWHVAHACKIVLDELFGEAAFNSDIKWKRAVSSGSSKAVSRKFPVADDTILLYTKSPTYTWNRLYLPYSEEYRKRYTEKDARGAFYWDNLKTYSQATLDRLIAEDRIKLPLVPGRNPRFKNYLHEGKGVPLDNLWLDLVPVNSQAGEDTTYPTQKPEALLNRILRASSNPGDLVLDCFCGSGTTAAVAEKLGRRWITCDLGRFAVHTPRKRLLGIPDVRPFVVQNLGKYERQAWQAAEFGAASEAQTAAYRRFLLDLYRARPVEGYVWLHGLRNGRMVHVGGVDAPVTMADVTSIVAEFRRATGTGKDAPTRSGVDLLGWDFAFELNETAKQQAGAAGIDLRLVRIPREVLEPKAVEQGDIRFYELAALSVTHTVKGRQVTLELTDFVVNPDDVPADVQGAITHWEQWIDYWAVDWNNGGDAFHNEWQAYRTRKQKALEKQTSHTYDAPGAYKVVVKVIDILGNDTTRVVPVEVR